MEKELAGKVAIVTGAGRMRSIGRLIAVTGSRGGVGATTLATGIAWTIAHKRRRRVALVDLDLQYGTVALALDLERAFESLSETSRAVVWLYDVEGYTHEEIAELMGKTVSFSKSQLARAHARLRRQLGGAEGATT